MFIYHTRNPSLSISTLFYTVRLMWQSLYLCRGKRFDYLSVYSRLGGGGGDWRECRKQQAAESASLRALSSLSRLSSSRALRVRYYRDRVRLLYISPTPPSPPFHRTPH
jgi:hypothetical protein